MHKQITVHTQCTVGVQEPICMDVEDERKWKERDELTFLEEGNAIFLSDSFRQSVPEKLLFSSEGVGVEKSCVAEEARLEGVHRHSEWPHLLPQHVHVPLACVSVM